MFKAFLLVAIAIVQCLAVEDKMIQDPVAETHLSAQQGQRVDAFLPRSVWSYYYPSWSLPSMSHIFKDDDDVVESPALLKRLGTLEKMVKELKDLLKKESMGNKKTESTTTPSNKVEASPCKESTKTTAEPQKNIEQPQPCSEKKPVDADKPTQPEKNAEQSKNADESKKPTEVSQNLDKSQKPIETGDDTKKDSPPPVKDEASKPSTEEVGDPREAYPTKERV